MLFSSCTPYHGLFYHSIIMLSTIYYYLLLAALVTTHAQESTVIQAFNGAHSQAPLPFSALQASIVSANALATTLALQCKPDAWDAFCTINRPNPPTITITEGPSTFTVSAVYPTKSAGVDGLMTLVQDCNITSSTRGAGCSVEFKVDLSASGSVMGTGTGTGTATSTSLQTRLREDEIYYRPVTVTAGVEKLNAPDATQMPGGAGSGGGVGGTGTGGIGGVAAAAAVAAAAMLI